MRKLSGFKRTAPTSDRSEQAAGNNDKLDARHDLGTDFPKQKTKSKARKNQALIPIHDDFLTIPYNRFQGIARDFQDCYNEFAIRKEEMEG